ncbi:hypothetical protein [Herbidospora cretacea]|uniref:hypothetical protein n=1 Tax=Herbidospora cretacea TaxID=28444 RepID=UPI0009DCFE74
MSSAAARDLLAQVGPNAVPEQRPGLAARAAKLWAPVPWMLEVTIRWKWRWASGWRPSSSPWCWRSTQA